MRRPIRTHSWVFILSAIALLAVPGCLSSSGPDFSLLFRVDPYDESTGPFPATAAEPEEGAIVITGGFETPCLARGGEIRASASQQGAEIRLHIRWEPAGPCETGVSQFVYEAVLAAVRAGTYRLTVVHVLPDAPDAVVLEQSLSVP